MKTETYDERMTRWLEGSTRYLTEELPSTFHQSLWTDAERDAMMTDNAKEEFKDLSADELYDLIFKD